MEHERGHGDVREDRAQVGGQVELEEDRRRLGRGRLALDARVLLHLVAARVRIEEAREHLRSEAPVDPRELDERLAHRIGNVVARGVGSEVDELLDLERVAHGELGGGEAAAAAGEDGGAAADGVDHRFELAALGLDRRPRLEQPIAEPAAEPVETDDAVRARKLGVERPLVFVVPLLLKVRDPARTDDDRRAVAVRRVGEPSPLEIEVADLLLHVRQE